MPDTCLTAQNVTKKFFRKGREAAQWFDAVSGVDVALAPGEFVVLMGRSGGGKSTLLNMMGLLERPDSGEIKIDGKSRFTNKEIMLMQRNKFGYLFQNYALIDNETVEKNLLIALTYRKNVNKAEEIKKVLNAVNLPNYEKRRIFELSGGEQQRIALARVILKNCDYIFADEPTGNLDKKNSEIIFDILETLNGEGKTVVYVTHNLGLANCANTKIEL